MLQGLYLFYVNIHLLACKLNKNDNKTKKKLKTAKTTKK
jgi:hypothetical protein